MLLCKMNMIYLQNLIYQVIRPIRQYPNETFLRIAKEVGNKIIIGTDAHESSALLDMQTYQYAKQYIENLGLELTEEIRFLRQER